MSQSPFMASSPRRSRAAVRRRRRRRRLLIGLALILAGLAAVAVVMLAMPRQTNGSRATRHAAAKGPAARPLGDRAAAPGQSGLPLGRPPLALDLADPRADPVDLPFHSPPRAGLLFNLDTGQVLWQRNPLARLRIASLTKMMTALLAVRSPVGEAGAGEAGAGGAGAGGAGAGGARVGGAGVGGARVGGAGVGGAPNTPVLITRQAEETNGSKVGVLPLGRHVELETLLYGLLLPSGNDAAVALAQHVAGTVAHFVAEMNAQAAALGMGCTHYSSPSGYYNTHNYSCAADLAELAHADLAQPRIARIARTAVAIRPFPIKGGRLYLYNNNPLLIYRYPGATGLKTGWTVEAGRCLVATAERHHVRLGVVLLNSPAPGTQARELLDYAFQRVYHQRRVPEPPMPAGA
jgi:serine-type D-Ala-D-Ala carboxypeptidase (penicillin-binding protein 5/6)